jgi:hypothetical protein
MNYTSKRKAVCSHSVANVGNSSGDCDHTDVEGQSVNINELLSMMSCHQLMFEGNRFYAYCFEPVLQCKLLSLFILGKTFPHLKQKQKKKTAIESVFNNQ